MKAAVLEAVGKPLVVSDDIEVDPPGQGEVLVRVTHCGLCHSDLSIVDGVFPAQVPIVLGHEAAGVVEEVGPGVTSLSTGDHVVLTAAPPCGRCRFCLAGHPTLCVEAQGIMTNTYRDGTTRLSRDGEVVHRGLGLAGFAENVVIQETGAVRIDPDIPLQIACLLGCAVQTGVGVVLNTAEVKEGSTVLVMGLGGVGLSTVQGAKVAGASRIIVSDPDKDRRETALRLGATDALDPTSEDVIGACISLTGVGVDYAFDAVGSAALVGTAIGAIRPGGAAVMVGAIPIGQTVTIDIPALVMLQEKRILGTCLGSCNSLRDIPRFLSLWRSGRLDLESLVTSVRPLGEINEACEDLRNARGIRTVLEIS